jgi:predicted dehydrogenase
MATGRVRAGIIGTGFMGRVHCEALRRLGTVEIAAVAGSSAEKAQAFAAVQAIPRAEGDHLAILADPSIDVVHVCTPNASHFAMASAAVKAGKHVMCEKPLAMTSAEAVSLSAAAAAKGVRHATCYNLRFYPMVQQMRCMREAGELGDILVAQGTYSQDWLLYDTDWNWRVEAKSSGPLRAMADIGSHWCDMLEHVSGERIAAVCADLATFHTLRHNTTVDTEDYGGVLFHLGARARGSLTVSQVAAGRKNRLSVEIYGTRASAAWNQERPDELWIGHRNGRNEILLKDPALLDPRAAAYADLPGGHAEGYGDTFKQLFRRFYQSIAELDAPRDYPQFDDGLRQMRVLDAALASHQRRGWADVAQA